jgi:hypothetical protein
MEQILKSFGNDRMLAHIVALVSTVKWIFYLCFSFPKLPPGAPEAPEAARSTGQELTWDVGKWYVQRKKAVTISVLEVRNASQSLDNRLVKQNFKHHAVTMCAMCISCFRLITYSALSLLTSILHEIFSVRV